MSGDEKFTHEQTIDAVRSFLEYGEQTYGDAQLGYYSGGGWAARCLRSHLADLEAPAVNMVQKDVGLQLLVIDLGESVVVKVERGEMPVTKSAVRKGNVILFDESFADIRTTIDGLDEDKPVPRIEQHSEDAEYRYKAIWRVSDEEQWTTISANELTALSELAGHPLPVYEGKQGKWERLHAFDWTNAKQQAADAGYGIDTGSFETAMLPFTAWRYTR